MPGIVESLLERVAVQATYFFWPNWEMAWLHILCQVWKCQEDKVLGLPTHVAESLSEAWVLTKKWTEPDGTGMESLWCSVVLTSLKGIGMFVFVLNIHNLASSGMGSRRCFEASTAVMLAARWLGAAHLDWSDTSDISDSWQDLFFSRSVGTRLSFDVVYFVLLLRSLWGLFYYYKATNGQRQWVFPLTLNEDARIQQEPFPNSPTAESSGILSPGAISECGREGTFWGVLTRVPKGFLQVQPHATFCWGFRIGLFQVLQVKGVADLLMRSGHWAKGAKQLGWHETVGNLVCLPSWKPYDWAPRGKPHPDSVPYVELDLNGQPRLVRCQSCFHFCYARRANMFTM